jgi:MtrB/PioB family decaheme-associated outer membrane protein
MKTNRDRLSALTSACMLGLLLLAGTVPAAAEEKAQEKGFSFSADPIVIGAISTDVDTRSSKFQEYRDLSSGATLGFDLLGVSGDGERVFDITGVNVRRDDARYTLAYGKPGAYTLFFDYNKIVHRFGNDGHTLYTYTGGGRYEIADPIQNAIQTALVNQFAVSPAGITYPFLNNLLAPYLAVAHPVNLALERDRTLARLDLGKMGNLSWGVEYTHELRSGTRPYGGSFGFGNATELPEPIDYATTGAELAGEWKGANGGLRFGYRYSDFKNNISTMYFDNPFRYTNSTDPSAYTGPAAGSINGAAVGFADLAASNQASLAFLAGKGKAGSWWGNFSASYNQMKQNDPLLPYTLNSSIVGLTETGAKFDPTNPINLPTNSADRKVAVTAVTALGGTRFADKLGLTFHYRFYDYDNKSPEIEFPGYVRFQAVWEAIGRVAFPYSYKKQNAGAELGWDLSTATRLSLNYDRESWDRTGREVKTTDENILKLNLDTHASDKLTFHGSYEYGDRGISAYNTAASNFSFIEAEIPTNLPGMRKFDEAARKYNAFNLLAQATPSDAWSFQLGANQRNEDYDKSQFGLTYDDTLQLNAEVSYTPGEKVNFYLFANHADRKNQLKSRQSGAAPSVNPLDDWTATFKEITDTLGAGLNAKLSARWSGSVTANYSKSDGKADIFSPPGGAPDLGFGFDNYEDIKLFSLLGRLEYQLSKQAKTGLFYRWEDYTLDSFILQGLRNYLPGALLLNPALGDYRGKVLGVDLTLAF